MEAAPRLGGHPDDDELGPPLGGDAGNVFTEAPGPRADDLPPHTDAVRAGHRGCGLEPLLQIDEPAVEARVQRQLALDDEGRDEDDLGAAVGREPAGEVECVLGLPPLEQRHDDAAVRDRAGPAREAARPAPEEGDVGTPHRMSW